MEREQFWSYMKKLEAEYLRLIQGLKPQEGLNQEKTPNGNGQEPSQEG